MDTRPLLRFLLVSLGLCGIASAQTSYALRDNGKTRNFTLAADEMHVACPAADLVAKLRAAAPDATIRESHEGRAVLAVPTGAPALTARADAIRRALPGARVEAVLYLRGAARDATTRRIATADVLVRVPAGQTAAALAASVGATGSDPVAVPGHAMLHFPSGFHALDAARTLQGRGLDAAVQLRRQHQPLFVPDDTLFLNQWHLRNSGQGGGTLGIDANVTPAWDITRGAGVTINVVDDGLQTLHPDLSPNCPSIASGFHHDFNSDDNDPAPVGSNRHGTSVGGVAAARGNNALGVSGAAPEAQLVGIRLIAGPSTDAEEASSLYWRPTGLGVDVCNNSWGPTVYYAGADVLGKQALQDAARFGRGGLGQITLFAAGNSQSVGNGSRDANANSFCNSRFVIAVAASSNFGEQCTYSQRGANVLVCAPSSDPFNLNLPARLGIWTTDNTGASGYNPGAGEPPDTNFTNSFGGTSSASPLTAGCVALMVAAAPGLGWRDVHEIVAATATQLQPADADWVVNGGGFKFNHKFGGGMVNATAAIVRALSWQNLGVEQTQSVAATGLPVSIPDNSAVGVTRAFDFSAGPNLRVERAEIVLRVTHANRSDLEITLTSPSGTRSLLSELRPRPTPGFFDDDTDIDDSGQGWVFTTTHAWGENSTGIWTLLARDRRTGGVGTIQVATVRLFGAAAPFERVGFEQPLYTVNEGGNSRIVRVRRVGAATGAFSVNVLTATQGTAVDTQDFSAVNTPVNFAAGEPFKDVTIPILQDSEQESPETIFLALTNPTNVALGGVSLTQITIQDDETRPVTVTATDAAAGETLPAASANPGTIVVARATADPTDLTVNLQITGTATAGTDYSGSFGGTAVPPLPTSITIPAFQTAVTFTITPIDDTTLEGSETIDVRVLAGLGYDPGTPATASVTLADDELPAIDITAPVPSVVETSSTPVSFVFTRAGADLARSQLVKFTVEGTAAPDDNYVALPDQVEIPIGATSVELPLQPIDDEFYIAAKTVTVRLFVTPEYREGFTTVATIRIDEDDALPDFKSPAVAIAAPARNARIDVPATVNASGTAKDNLGIVRVVYAVNDGPRRTATGTTAWSADITGDLVPGPNKLAVQSEDASSNLSPAAVVTFHYVRERTLTVALHTNGAASSAGGSVTKAFFPQATLEAGQRYTITATPAAGFVFAGWSGDLTALARAFTFTMPDADTQLVAEFLTDPFVPTIQGTYTGPVRATVFSWADAGMIQLAVNAKGSFTGTLSLAGAKLPLRGEFNGAGRYRTTVLRPRNTPLVLDLTLDLTAAAQGIGGTVSSPDFTSTVLAARAGFSKTAPYPLSSGNPKSDTFTFVLPAETTPPLGSPQGTGFGTLSIDAAGTVKWSATLPDGTPASGTAPMTDGRRCVFFASLYSGKGLVLGELFVFNGTLSTDVTGDFDWIKPESPRDKAFLNGFTRLAAEVEGSLYIAPGKPPTETAFETAPTMTGAIDIVNGNVPAPIHQTFKLTLENKLTINGLDPRNPPNGIFVTVDAAKGLFSGSFLDPQFPSKTVRKFKGVISQKFHTGRGGFLGDTLTHTGLQTGTVTLAP